MRILLVEDDPLDRERISETVRSALGTVEIDVCSTEQQFRSELDRVLADGLDLAIIDALLPWTLPGIELETAPTEVTEGSFRRAGARCASLLASKADSIPIIVYSAAERLDIDLPRNVFYVPKDDDARTLIRLMKSVVRGAHVSNSVQSVFVVHGHDVEARETVARFIERLGLRAVVLHEQANRGQTIIEKFEEHSAVPYAVVLLTGDDLGSSKSSPGNLQPRARQNVILELGFFIGKLGRRNVCALHKSGIEIPSDYQGVAYIEMDSGEAWKSKLAREMKASGLSIDVNKIL
jgi:DNA-binding NarL/FixJ family response regulator